MKIIYKYKGNTKKGEIGLEDNNSPLEISSDRALPFILLGEDQGSFLEFCAAFLILAPFPEENNFPPPMEGYSTLSLNVLQSEDQIREYVELITLSGFDAEGYFKRRVLDMVEQLPLPQLQRSSLVPLPISIEGSGIEDLEIVQEDARVLLSSLDPRIKVEDIIVTPVKNNITVLPDNSNPLNEDNIYSHLEDYNIQCCSTLRVAKPSGFGCVPTDLAYNVIMEEEVSVEAYRISSLNSELIVGNPLPDYSFGVTGRYKINDGPWLTYQRLSTDTEIPSGEYELQDYNSTSWDQHVNNFFRSIKDLEGRRIFSFQGGGAEYVPFEIARSRNSSLAIIQGAELDFDNLDEPYYPPPIDMYPMDMYPEEGPEEGLEQLEAVDKNRQITVYFQVTQEPGRLADIINTIFGKDEEVRSCCYTTWPGY